MDNEFIEIYLWTKFFNLYTQVPTSEKPGGWQVSEDNHLRAPGQWGADSMLEPGLCSTGGPDTSEKPPKESDQVPTTDSY